MARISTVTADPNADDWVSPGLEFDDLEIRTRGFTDAYQDELRARLQRTAKAYQGDASRIPEAIRRDIGTDVILKHVTLDVRNLDKADGTPVTFAELKQMVREPRYRPLLDALYAAAQVIQNRRASDTEDAAGNSAPPSA